MEIKPATNLAPIGNAYGANTNPTLVPPLLGTGTASTAPVGIVVQTDPNARIEQVNQALESINKAMRSLNADLEFTVDADTGRSIIRVTDKQTGELLRQMPSKEALEIAKALDKVEGLLIRHKV